MKGKPMQSSKGFLLLALILALLLLDRNLQAADPETTDLIKQLQKRIEELEQKVQALESAKSGGSTTNDAQSKQHLDELDQKVKIMERDQELAREAVASETRNAPTVSLGLNG